MAMRFTKYLSLIVLFLILAGCSPTGNELPELSQFEPTTLPATAVPTEPPPTNTPIPPTATPPPPTTTPIPPTATEPPPTATPEATIAREPLWTIGTIADWTGTNDPVGIEGVIEVTTADKLVIRDFVSLVSEAPGVDIRLGIGDDFSDAVAVSLKDITGDEFNGRSLTLTIPDEAFDGRSFDAIGVFCYDTGDLFDYALFVAP